MKLIYLLGLIGCFVLICSVLPASAQERDRYYEDRIFRDCQITAERRSGYRGEVPTRYQPGGALEGAVRGGRRAAMGSWITGGDRDDRRRARNRGAAIGAIVGAAKRQQWKDEQDRRRRDYRYELDRCMRDYY